MASDRNTRTKQSSGTSGSDDRARGASRGKRRKRPQSSVNLLSLLALVLVVLLISEGHLVYIMFTQTGSEDVSVSASGGAQTAAAPEEAAEPETGFADNTEANPGSVDLPLAGFSSAASGSGEIPEETPREETEPAEVYSEQLDSPVVVGKTEPPVDDSYFSDAVFIGDSRMEGFRNASGITQGTFLTSVGLNISSMSAATIATADGTISVYQGLSGTQYSKIYVMLGTNDLGYYPWEMFPDEFSGVIEQFHKLQPGAIIYICSVIYLEEALAAQSASYNTNENVRIINDYLLEVAEEHSEYCCYLNLNEIFSNGYGALKEGYSSDGVHLYESALQEMLQYLKNHYVPVEASAETYAEEDTDTGADA